MTTTTAPFTLGEYYSFCLLAEAAVHGSKVRRLTESGDIIEGVARSLGDEHGNFARDEDVRDLYLRVSSTFEYFWPVPELMALIRRGEFVVD